MKQFFSSFFGAFTGVVFVVFVAFLLIGGAIAGAMLAGEDGFSKVKDGVLHLKFDAPIPELTNNVEPSSALSIDLNNQLGLNDYVRIIDAAKFNDDIHGIYMDLGIVDLGEAKSSVLRRAIEDFKTSGKFVIAYSEYYTQKTYALATVADSIYVNPIGQVFLTGYSAQVPFFKDMLDKLGVKAQVFHVGEYKSATEPFRLTEMSSYNKAQIRELLTERYDDLLTTIEDSRGVSKDSMHAIIDGLLVRDAATAVTNNLVDGAKYEDEVIALLKKLCGKKKEDKIKLFNLASVEDEKVLKSLNINPKGKDHIAVVVAEGGIVDGQGSPGEIGGERYMRLIRKLRQDENVKGIVLRVNSGGGSALASELIWRELELAKTENNLPVITSMGDYAASGGYYIAAPSDAIFAEPNTVTGSIGVFGIIPSAQQFLKDKVGVTFDTVRTAQYSTQISPFRDISEAEGDIIQAGVERIYETFLTRVAEGRGMDKIAVNEVAKGRVWSGKKALELGLVDKLGGLSDAITAAQSMSEPVEPIYYPLPKDAVTTLLSNGLKGGPKSSIAIKEQLLKEELKDFYPIYKEMESLKTMSGVQARMPFVLD